MSGIKHEGLHVYRLAEDQENPLEQIYARRWREENGSHLHLLISLLSDGRKIDPFSLWSEPPLMEVTQNIATAVATVVQWLGSNVGQSFVQEALREHGYVLVERKGAIVATPHRAGGAE